MHTSGDVSRGPSLVLHNTLSSLTPDSSSETSIRLLRMVPVDVQDIEYVFISESLFLREYSELAVHHICERSFYVQSKFNNIVWLKS